jgi:nicotinate dehydrogenase subunit A
MADTVQLIVNGNRHAVEIERDERLLNVLRERLGLTGSKYGCGEGQCGACTVLVDGRAMKSCITLVRQVAGKPITTIEGLAREGGLHPVQQAFVDAGAMQCGYCTPGMIMGSVALLQEHSAPSPSQIAEGMQGHVCRCGTYARIVQAVAAAAATMKGGA